MNSLVDRDSIFIIKFIQQRHKQAAILIISNATTCGCKSQKQLKTRKNKDES